MKHEWIDIAQGVHRSLWIRCILSMGLIACLVLSSYVVFTHRIERQRFDSAVINVSGRQRMLSQRIAVMTMRYVTSDAQSRSRIKVALTDAVQLMSSSHHALTRGKMKTSEAAHRHYFEAPVALDREVATYLNHANTILQLKPAQFDINHPSVVAILNMSETTLLKKLDQVVRIYELEANQKIKALERIEFYLALVMLALLVGIVVLILRPMINDVACAIDRSERAGEAMSQYILELQASQQQLEHEARQREAAQHASKTKSHFLANVSHELRTPLNAIIGYSEILIEDFETQDEYVAQDLTKIHSSAKHLLSLINDLLDISKVEAGRMELSASRFMLQPFIEHVAQTARPLMLKNNNTLVIQSNHAQIEIQTDRQRLFQALLNLISNAAKFTHDGTVTLNVELDSKWLRVDVIDTGIGMSEQVQQKIFEPFTQANAETSHQFGGTGLGLKITQDLAAMLGGAIEVTSVPGHGSTFSLRVKRELQIT